MLMVMKLTNSNKQTINELIRLMQADKSVDAPEDSVKWAKNLFRARAADPKQSFAQKVLAVLQVNLSPNQAVFGERSATAVRQMLFSAGASSIDLRITPGEKGVTVAGQILGEDFANAEAKLENSENTFTSKANELSEFKLENVSLY